MNYLSKRMPPIAWGLANGALLYACLTTLILYLLFDGTEPTRFVGMDTMHVLFAINAGLSIFVAIWFTLIDVGANRDNQVLANQKAARKRWLEKQKLNPEWEPFINFLRLTGSTNILVEELLLGKRDLLDMSWITWQCAKIHERAPISDDPGYRDLVFKSS